MAVSPLTRCAPFSAASVARWACALAAFTFAVIAADFWTLDARAFGSDMAGGSGVADGSASGTPTPTMAMVPTFIVAALSIVTTAAAIALPYGGRRLPALCACVLVAATIAAQLMVNHLPWPAPCTFVLSNPASVSDTIVRVCGAHRTRAHTLMAAAAFTACVSAGALLLDLRPTSSIRLPCLQHVPQLKAWVVLPTPRLALVTASLVLLLWSALLITRSFVHHHFPGTRAPDHHHHHDIHARWPAAAFAVIGLMAASVRWRYAPAVLTVAVALVTIAGATHVQVAGTGRLAYCPMTSDPREGLLCVAHIAALRSTFLTALFTLSAGFGVLVLWSGDAGGPRAAASDTDDALEMEPMAGAEAA